MAYVPILTQIGPVTLKHHVLPLVMLCIFLGNGIVSWLSRRQRRVTLSSTEAEYCGMTETAKQLRWIRNLYEELGFKLGPLSLCVDNQGAIFLASNPAQEGRTKHVWMTEHFI